MKYASLVVSTAAFLLVAFPAVAEAPAPAEGSPAMHRVYVQLLEPREHPDYDRRHVQPPSWDTFGNRTRFAALRGFAIEGNRIVRYAEELEKYTRTWELGDVVWPSYPIVFAENLGALADEIKQRGLFLFDIWGYVPGSGPGGYWQQYKPDPSIFPMLEATLGDHWLGMDVGEQDGRYIGGYAGQMLPVSGDRFEQYLNFQRHFEYMCNELGNRMSTLVSLNFGHHFLKEGVYTTIGAETAQALPNGQVYYAWIRGAGKQYGVPWFGNASVWNRWGWKSYSGTGDGPPHGPTHGTSLNLLKRLMYSHILYNSVFVGFESGWFEGDGLSPIGRIQQAAKQWVREYGQPGVMITPIALMTDFFSGWSFPRHLYTGHVYRVWGNLPYDKGDYLMDDVLDMLYPGYQDASYYHDETGFITPTPYGDSADCLLSDAPLWLLERYPVLVIAGTLPEDLELRDKLKAYAEDGGHLVITGGTLAKFPEGLAGISVSGSPVRVDKGQAVGDVTEDHPFDAYPISAPPEARILAGKADAPLAVEAPMGKGTITVIASPYGLPREAVTGGRIANTVDQPLAKPYPLLEHVRAALDGVFRRQILFEAGEGLSLITCRKGPGEYTLGVSNNSLEERPFSIRSHCGEIESITELPTDQAAKKAPGYLPTGFESVDPGMSTQTAIAGGDVRLFSVTVREEQIETIPHIAPPPRPRGRALPLREGRSIKEQLLRRPTFFEHFDGAVVDWRYLHNRDRAALEEEAGWLQRQGLRIYVDLTSGINLYPDIRLVDNSAEEYAASMAIVGDVLEKMAVLGARDVILCLHRTPENNFSGEQTWASFETALGDICARAKALDIAVYLRMSTKDNTPLERLAHLVTEVGAPNLSLALSTALLLHQKTAPESIPESIRAQVGLWLVGAPQNDIAGELWNTCAPLSGADSLAGLRALMAIAPGAPLLLDALYTNRDEEYLDALALARLRPAP